MKFQKNLILFEQIQSLLMIPYPPYENIDIPPLVVHEHIVASKHMASWDIPLGSVAKRHLATMSDEELDNDWKLNEFFGTIAIINLPNDIDRLKRVTEELKRIGTHEFEIFSAIDGRKTLDISIWDKLCHNRDNVDASTPEGQQALDRLHQGEAGCYMSHFRLIQKINNTFNEALKELETVTLTQNSQAIAAAKNLVRKFSRILILEDDNGFGIVNVKKTKSSKVGCGHILRQAIQDLPDNWDMLYLTCAAHEKSKAVAAHLYRLKRSVFLNAYVINYTMYDSLIDTLKQIENPLVSHVLPVDKAISGIHYRYHVYAVYPSIAFQYEGKSSINSTQTYKLRQGQPKLRTQKHTAGR